MQIFSTIFKLARQYNNLFLFTGFGFLVVLGLMNVVHNLTYQKPTDGAIWQLRNGQLTVVETDFHPDTVFRVGDALERVDDLTIKNERDYEDFLYSEPIGSKHLYVFNRDGDTFEYFIKIRGNKNLPLYYYLFATSGFVYLLFIFLIRSQNIKNQAAHRLTLFCTFVFLAFVFHHRESFTALDWLSLYLDFLGRFLLPSSLAALALGQIINNPRFLPFAQATHWFVSILLYLAVLYWIPRITSASDFDTGMALFHQVQEIQRYWSGVLITASVLVLSFLYRRKERPNYGSLFWSISWLPFALDLWEIQFPLGSAMASLAPLLLPIALISEWSRNDQLELGDFGKKMLVNLSVVIVLFLGYFFFVLLFQSLLGAQLARQGQAIISGLGIMFAVFVYAPLRDTWANLVDRMIYGKRYHSIRGLLDFSLINRADTNTDTFLQAIRDRVSNAFAIEAAVIYKLNGSTFHFDLLMNNSFPPEIPPSFIPTKLNTGEMVFARELDPDLLPGTSEAMSSHMKFNVGDLLCPIRISGELKAMLVLSNGAQGVKLSAEETRLLQSLLNQCEVLMENMDLYQTLSQRAVHFNQLKEFNENIIESSRIGILATDEMERAVSCNRAFSDLCGLTKDVVMGKAFSSCFTPKEVSRRQIKTGFSFEGTFTNASGETVIIDVQQTPLKSKDNEIYGTLYLVEDIREKKEFAEKMMQQEKLASIGLLAAGVAHEINTPLTGITSYSQFLLTDPQANEDQRDLLHKIQGQSLRAAEIVKTLLNFSRRETKTKGPVDLGRLVSETIDFLGHQIKRAGVRVILKNQGEQISILGNANQLQQVFINLIVNAMDAMPNGGELCISWSNRGRWSITTVSDTGMGIPDDIKNRIFDPFFTTKEVGKGTGLGLSIVYNIVREHGGTLEVQSKHGVGTTFSLGFPVSPE